MDGSKAGWGCERGVRLGCRWIIGDREVWRYVRGCRTWVVRPSGRMRLGVLWRWVGDVGDRRRE